MVLQYATFIICMRYDLDSFWTSNYVTLTYIMRGKKNNVVNIYYIRIFRIMQSGAYTDSCSIHVLSIYVT